MTLDPLDNDALVRILREPKNALVRQYAKLFSLDGVDLVFEDDAVRAIAELAIERNTGARGLRAIMESVLMDIMYDVPSRKDISRVIITKETVTDHAPPRLVLRDEVQNISLFDQMKEEAQEKLQEKSEND